MSLKITGRANSPAQISLNSFSVRERAIDAQSGDVSCPTGRNALPLMMQPEFVREAAFETFCLAYVDGIPATIRSPFDEDVNAGRDDVAGIQWI